MRLAFRVVSLVLVLLLVEVAFRLATDPEGRVPRLFAKGDRTLAWVRPAEFRPRREGWIGVTGDLTYQHLYPTDPRGYFGPEGGVTYRTNAFGFRGALQAAPDDGTRQVVFLGDSFTYGEGVRFEDLFATRAAPLLQTRAVEGIRIETINLGQPGVDTLQEAMILDHVGAHTTPRLVVLVYVPNDWPSELVSGAHFVDIQGRYVALYESQRLARWWRTGWWFRDRIRLLRLQRSFAATIDRIARELPEDEAGGEAAHSAINEIRARAEGRGAEFTLVVLPELLRLDDRYPYRGVHEALAELGRQKGFPVIDLLPDFLGRDPAALWVHEIDHHPNEIAHGIIAKRIAAELQADFLVPRGGAAARLHASSAEQ